MYRMPALDASLNPVSAPSDPDLVLVSGSSAGVAGNGTSFASVYNENIVFITTSADNLVAGDVGGHEDIFEKDLTTGAITRVSTTSTGDEANGNSLFNAVTIDGTGLLFSSNASNLFAGGSGTNRHVSDIYYKNLTTGIVQQVTSSAAGVHGDGQSTAAYFMHDQTKVVVVSEADNLIAGDDNGSYDVFIKDLSSGAVTLVSTNSEGIIGNSFSDFVQTSADDHTVYLMSDASNLVTGDTNLTMDIFAKNLTTGVMTRLSTTSSDAEINGTNYALLITPDDKTLLFSSDASNLATGHVDYTAGIYAKDLSTGAVTVVSSNAVGTIGNGSSSYLTATSDAKNVIFASEATDLISGDTNGSSDVFLKNAVTGETTRIFTAAAHRNGDSYQYKAQYADHDSKIVLSVTYSNPMDTNVGSARGIIALISTTTVYVIDLTTLAATLVTSGAIGRVYGFDNDVAGFQNEYSLNTVSPDGQHLFLDSHQSAFSPFQYPGFAPSNAYLTILSDSLLQKTVGDAGANTLTGSSDGNTYMFGFAGNDSLTSGAGNDFMDGGSGADIMTGGLGDDTYYVDNGSDVIHEFAGQGTDTVNASVSWTLGASLENLNLVGTGNINGTGNANANVIEGNDGNNVLDGGTGADTMRGGDGDDTYRVDNVKDVVIEVGRPGVDLVISSVDYTLGNDVENLTLTGTALKGIGGSGDNVIKGTPGNNILDGSYGVDTLIGGIGDDTYFVDNVHDAVVEAANGGTDTVKTTVSFSLAGQFIENLILTGTADIDAIGNSQANSLTGNSGDNILNGGYGADTMTGGLGDDTYIIDNAGDIVKESAGQGTDLVKASVTFSLSGQHIENLTLTSADAINATGNGMSNVLTGNNAANVLNGSYGADTLTGRGGADTFLFGTASGDDTIADFSAAEGDLIDVKAYTHGTAHLAYLVQVGGDVEIQLGGSNVITVTAASVADVSAHMVW